MVWIRFDGAGEKMQVAVHRMQRDECPWKDLLADTAHVPSSETSQDPEKPISP